MVETIKSECLDSRPYRLKNVVQPYSWGTRNDNAFIAHLLGIEPEENQPYAELWMGVHPNAPSQILDPEKGPQNLAAWLLEKPDERLSLSHSETSPNGLPYLLKVLSASQALSIQAHPNKTQAENLHQRDPEHYPDDNHKPEVAIAIDFLDAMVGFISNESYSEMLKANPEVDLIMGNAKGSSVDIQAGVQKLLHLWDGNRSKVVATIQTLQQRISQKSDPDETESLFLEQIEESGNSDIGLLFLFLLKRVHLGPGEAVFLAPGVPHAYLKGNIIECMANSDNVVRLGLTEKFCDSKALAEILVFDEQSDYSVEITSDGYLSEYLSPTKEFRLKSLNLMQGESRAFSYRNSLTMFLVLDGEVSLHWGDKENSCTSVYRRGNSFIAPANLEQFTLQSRNHSKLYFVDFPGGDI